MTYIGIKIGPSLEKLVNLNLKPIMRLIKDDLNRWGTLPVSWLGRISVLKINILPRLLYPLQMLPTSIPNGVVIDLDRMFTQFTWQGKKVRMKASNYREARIRGVSEMHANVLLGSTYWAAHIYIYIYIYNYIYEWVNPDVTNTWIEMESRNCGTQALRDYLFVIYKKAKLEVQNNSIVLNTLNTWKIHNR